MTAVLAAGAGCTCTWTDGEAEKLPRWQVSGELTAT